MKLQASGSFAFRGDRTLRVVAEAGLFGARLILVASIAVYLICVDFHYNTCEYYFNVLLCLCGNKAYF